MTKAGVWRLLLVALVGAWSFCCSTEPAEKSPAECNAVDLDDRQRCFWQRALKSEDTRWCHELGSLTEQVSCVEAVATDAHKPELCGGIPRPKARDKCLSKLAASLSKPDACKSIENEFRRDECLTEVAGTGNGVATACQAIVNETQRDDCYVRLATRDNAPTDVCDRVKGRKDACWSALARRLDPALCERVGTAASSASRHTCYVSAFTGTVSATSNPCRNIKNGALQKECELHHVAATSDMKACEDGKLGERTDECWAALARHNGDLCLRINDAGHRRYCALWHWTAAKNPAVCELLVLPEKQAECRKRTLAPGAGQ